ncbi:RDD family protein [Streptomyces sp. 8N114]|uniref:RDD family protein n=1 Tax=Streptomyces sp. 8N114 TaxID=3457419 RepID=UPI003FCFBDBB
MPTDSVQETARQPGELVLASRSPRFAARLVDLIIWAVASTPVLAFVTANTEEGNARAIASVCGSALMWTLLNPLPLSRFGVTLGKRLVGVQIVRMRTGTHPGFFQALWRELFYLLMSVIPFVGLLNVASCLWDKPYQQCWHDNAAGTLAVDRKALAARRAAARTPAGA